MTLSRPISDHLPISVGDFQYPQYLGDVKHWDISCTLGPLFISFLLSPSPQAAKNDLSQASAKLQRAMEDMQAAQEKFGDAKAKVTDIKEPRPLKIMETSMI